MLTSVLANRFIAKHPSPSRFTFALERGLAVSIDTSRQTHTFGAIGTSPPNATFTVIGSGTISISRYAGRITDGVSAIVFFVLVTWQTQDMPILVTNIVIVGLSNKKPKNK